MNHPEQCPAHPQEVTSQQAITAPLSWKSYVQQLGDRFQIRITEPGTKLILCGRDPRLRLLIGTHRTFAVVSHGQTTEDYELLPDEEICFDITEEGDWVPSEIMYTSEVWDDFQEMLRQANLPPTAEHSFDSGRFAPYLLDKVVREEWTDVRITET